MKRLATAVMAAIMAILSATAFASHGSLSYTGAIEAQNEIALSAPFSGRVDAVNFKVGDVVNAGDVVAVMRTEKVYSPISGTVEAIFADVGYDATAVSSRYGGVLFIEPTNKYTLYVDDKYAYESVSAMYAHLGDTVYLKCVTDGSHVGTGRITAIDDDGVYTVETTAGEFYPGEAVRVYNRERKYDVDRIGRGTIIVSTPETVSAEGYIVNRFVEVGDTVEKGQLIMETVTDLPSYEEYTGTEIISPVSGIVTQVLVSEADSVSSQGVVAYICPMEDMGVEIELTEEELAEVGVGTQLELVFEQVPGELRLTGEITGISYIPQSILESSTSSQSADAAEAETDDTVYYKAYVDFPATDGLRLGMTATVYRIN
ncbi:MAG: HlyD family efflux transporter periplasmic adaptor subunit [Clostridia bacterium]|nr:HlyD family efflux transporter periplasmic adaptor subunit [Clostridia bacterium]